MVNASRSPLGLGTDEQLLQVVPRVRTRIESQWTDQVDQGPATRRIEISNQLIWTDMSKTKVAPTPMTKAFHTNHTIQVKPTPKALTQSLPLISAFGSPIYVARIP